MGEPQLRQKKLEEVQEQLKKLSTINPESLARIEDLSRDINFSEAVPYFETMIDVIKNLQQRDLSRLGIAHLNDILKACNLLEGQIDSVRSFDLNQNTPGDVCKGIISKIQGIYDEFMQPLTLPLAFTASQATDYAKIEREAEGCNARMKEQAKEFEDELQKHKKEIGSVLSAVKEAAAEVGVSTNAHIFVSESETHHRAANLWIIGTGISLALTIGVAIFFVTFSLKYTPASTAQAIQYVVSKVILLSTLSFGVFWCSRNYKSSKHNETLNKHRANALMTFQAFVAGSGDSQVKEAILLQAAQAAFVNRPTGYESQEKESQAINPVVEILGKSMAKSIPQSSSTP